jgi:hypothetical protein
VQRKSVVIAIVIVTIGVLFAAAIVSMRPGGVEPRTRRERSAREADADARSEPREAREEGSEEDPSAESEDEAPLVPSGCEHPFVPSAIGEWRRYRWRQSGEERSAVLRIDARRARDIEDGQRAVVWRVRVTASDDASELANEELTTRCTPGRDAEEPWFGILERSLGLELTSAPGRWRLPAELAPGVHIDGTATFDPGESEMRVPEGASGREMLRVARNHVVGEREEVVVPAGRYRAWRIDYEERQTFGQRVRTGPGTLWIAPEVGLVKSRAENSEGVVHTMELTAFGRR